MHTKVCSVQVQLINDAYNLVIDAMLGPEADCADIKEPYSGILVTLKQVKIPIASVDVPSGKFSYKMVDIRLEAQKHNMINEPPGSSLGALAPGLFQIWQYVRRINLMLQSAHCELILTQIHSLLSVSTTGRKLSQSSYP